MHVVSVQVGRPRTITWQGKKVQSSIHKSPIIGRVPTVGHNLAGDRQADGRVHGGEFKAIYAYPCEHYPFWEEVLGHQLGGGSFGENLTTVGLVESEIRPGDRFKVGSIEVIASTPRMPCYKLGMRLNDDSMVQRFLEAERPGIYFAISKHGDVGENDPIELLERSAAPLTIVDLMRLYSGKDKDRGRLEAAAALECIPHGWRERFQRNLGG